MIPTSAVFPRESWASHGKVVEKKLFTDDYRERTGEAGEREEETT